MRTLSADLDLDPRLTVVSDLEALRQYAVQRLRFLRGEWVINVYDGTPVVPELEEQERLILRELLAIDDIEDASLISGVDGKTRVATLTTRLGTVEIPI